MQIQNFIFIAVFLAAIGFFSYNILRIRSYLELGRSDNRFANPGRRISRMISVGLGQSKILRDPVAGIMHALIFWGFMTLITAVIEALVQGFYSSFSIVPLGKISKAIFLLQDVFGILVVLSVIYALFRRYVIHPKR